MGGHLLREMRLNKDWVFRQADLIEAFLLGYGAIYSNWRCQPVAWLRGADADDIY